jgi:thiamine-phosphate pyrophosphorylase
MKPLSQCRLYTFIDTEYLNGRDPVAVAHQLCSGGSDVIQLRAKKSSRDEILRMAEEILPVVRAQGVWFVINDHPDVAAETGADACHLGQEDFAMVHMPDGEDSKPPNRVSFGLSTHSPEQAIQAIKAQPAYIAIGPVYATPTKPGAKPVTLDYVRWAAANVKIPWFAIGGINLKTLDAVIAAGAERVCAVSAILNVPDIAEACRQFKMRLP